MKVQLRGLAESLPGVLSSLARRGRDENFSRLGYRVFLHQTAKRAPLVYSLIGFPQAGQQSRQWTEEKLRASGIPRL